MPIIFRCPGCNKKLSVTRRKAGQPVDCPKCQKRIVVPSMEEAVTAEPVPTPAAASQEPDLTKQQAGEFKLDAPTQHWSPERNHWLDGDDEEEPFKIDKRGMDDDGLDMTPMVDVTFLLLIFFMITASFAVQKSLQTTPPEPDEEGVSQNVSQEDVEEESVVVEIDAENNIRVDDVPVSGIAELVDVLTAKRASENKGEMLIEVHELATHGTVVAVTDAGLDADMQRIRRSTKHGDE
ncbi:MAG: biopolymer transporter ExbD [Planctomycetaceae bacterium]|nr:biopolymer transporter ExbD [Planctomycetaceae bacterium]MCA9042710.1 biopolymer transporter ExbD [Planctomycetaceae bacterium]